MRFPIVLTVISALVGLSLVLGFGTLLIRPPQELILEAGFDSETISPNADGEADVSRFHYEISRNASVSIIFENENGQSYFFREKEPRSPESYEVLFSGVVDGYVLEGEALALNVDENPNAMVVERRLLPNGNYTWRMIAENETEVEEKSGAFVIENGDTDLPIMTIFTLSTSIFTPNRDGVNDRVTVNIFLEKDAQTRVYLVDNNNVELPIAEREEWSCRPEDECGRYSFDYEGGVDLNQSPPPDGTYRIVAEAQDAVGQRIRRESALSIERGGVPRAEISPQNVDADVFWIHQAYEDRFLSNQLAFGDAIGLPPNPSAIAQSQIDIPNGDMLVFKLTVDNYGDVAIRTTNPPAGTVYQQNQVPSSINALEEAGAWRVGIQCDTSLGSFPYRWALGTPEDWITIHDEETGNDYTYLPAHTRVVVWGAIRLTEQNHFANPQTCWAGLIHEQVGISVENNNVSPIEVQIGDAPESGTNGE